MTSNSAGDYPLGYGAGAQSWLLARTPQSHAGFLIPHLKPGMRLMDAACGPGVVTLGLAQLVSPGEVVGLDFEPSQVERATAAARERGVANVRFELANIYDIPQTDDSFDAAFAGAILGHLRSPQAALREICRVLKPGGVAGFREFDHGGDIFFPTPPPIAECIELYTRLMGSDGKHRNAGRRLKSWLHETGFDVADVGASYDVFNPKDYAQSAIKLFQESVGPALIKAGLTDASRLTEYYAAWKELGDDPDAFIAGAWVHAVARKP